MGNPLKRRAIRTRLARWNDDLIRIRDVFGEYDPAEDSEEADVQRALENLLDKAEALAGRY